MQALLSGSAATAQRGGERRRKRGRGVREQGSVGSSEGGWVSVGERSCVCVCVEAGTGGAEAEGGGESGRAPLAPPSLCYAPPTRRSTTTTTSLSSLPFFPLAPPFPPPPLLPPHRTPAPTLLHPPVPCCQIHPARLRRLPAHCPHTPSPLSHSLPLHSLFTAAAAAAIARCTTASPHAGGWVHCGGRRRGGEGRGGVTRVRGGRGGCGLSRARHR